MFRGVDDSNLVALQPVYIILSAKKYCVFKEGSKVICKELVYIFFVLKTNLTIFTIYMPIF